MFYHFRSASQDFLLFFGCRRFHDWLAKKLPTTFRRALPTRPEYRLKDGGFSGEAGGDLPSPEEKWGTYRQQSGGVWISDGLSA